MLPNAPSMLFGASFHNRFERLPKCVSWAPACSKVVELLFRRAQHVQLELFKSEAPCFCPRAGEQNRLDNL